MYNSPIFKEFIDKTKDVLYNKNIIIPETSDKAAIYIDNRINEHIKYSIYNHMYFLDGKFTLYFFHSKENEEYIKTELKDLKNIKYIKFDTKVGSHTDYTNFMLTNFVYDQIVATHILMFQYDSMMFKHWDDIYNDYDYLGAPWSFPEVGGNGGYSYRSKDLVKKTISNISFLKKNLQLDGQNEDHILSISAYFHGMKVNGLEDGRKFSVETIYDEDTMACHQIHHYQTEENIRKIINKVRYD